MNLDAMLRDDGYRTETLRGRRGEPRGSLPRNLNIFLAGRSRNLALESRGIIISVNILDSPRRPSFLIRNLNSNCRYILSSSSFLPNSFLSTHRNPIIFPRDSIAFRGGNTIEEEATTR